MFVRVCSVRQACTGEQCMSLLPVCWLITSLCCLQSHMSHVDDVVIDTAADLALRARDKVRQMLDIQWRILACSQTTHDCVQGAVLLALLQIGVAAPVFEEVWHCLAC